MLENPRSVAKTRPRISTSVFSCSRVVENTQAVESPEWASAMHRHASHKTSEFPRAA